MKKHTHLVGILGFLFIITGLVALLFNLNCCDLKSLCHCGCCEEDDDEIYM